MNLHDIIAGLEHLLEHLRHHAGPAPAPQAPAHVEPVAAGPVQPSAPAAPVAPETAETPAAATPQTGTHNWLTDDIARQAGQQHDVAPSAAAAPGWTPSPTMKYADCTGENIPLTPSTTYTITECPASTRVETNLTSLPCAPYILTVNGVETRKDPQVGQCTVVATEPTITVSVRPIPDGGVVNLILQVQPG
jgi:hypothetical protein